MHVHEPQPGHLPLQPLHHLRRADLAPDVPGERRRAPDVRRHGRRVDEDGSGCRAADEVLREQEDALDVDLVGAPPVFRVGGREGRGGGQVAGVGDEGVEGGGGAEGGAQVREGGGDVARGRDVAGEERDGGGRVRGGDGLLDGLEARGGAAHEEEVGGAGGGVGVGDGGADARAGAGDEGGLAGEGELGAGRRDGGVGGAVEGFGVGGRGIHGAFSCFGGLVVGGGVVFRVRGVAGRLKS